nr:TA system VapC family ribonuclease toxin [Ornithinimicrobium cryptoxanthini]
MPRGVDVLFLDVNVCLDAFRPTSSEDAGRVHSWLASRVTGDEQLGVSEFVLSAMVRIATHPKIYAEPAPVGAALDFADALLAAPATTVVRPGGHHWRLFSDLARTYDLRGNHIPDAYLAALAMEHAATFVTRDRRIGRFPGLRMLDPSIEQA